MIKPRKQKYYIVIENASYKNQVLKNAAQKIGK